MLHVMDSASAIYIRLKFKDIRKWVKISCDGDIFTNIDAEVKKTLHLPEDCLLEYYDEHRFQLNKEILVDYIWFNAKGVTIEVKLEGENFNDTLHSEDSKSTISLSTSSIRSLFVEDDNSDFENILRGSSMGRDILLEYESKNDLSVQSRRKLTNLIVSHLIENYGNYPDKNIKVKFAKDIVKFFKCFEDSEGRGYEIFYNPILRTGFLETRFRTINRGVPKKSCSAEESVNETNKENVNINVAVNEETQNKINYLKTASNNENLLIFQYMKETFNVRRFCSNKLEEFPRFKDIPGLILQDFQLSYPELETFNFLEKFESLVPKILAEFSKISTTSADDLEGWEENVKALLALVHLFPPVARGKGTKKEPVLTNRLLVFHKVSLPLHEVLENKSTKQPFLLAVGLDKQTISDIYMIINNEFIKCQSNAILGAFQELFAAYFIFNLEYDIHLKSFYNFIQNDVFKIKNANNYVLTPKDRETRNKLLK